MREPIAIFSHLLLPLAVTAGAIYPAAKLALRRWGGGPAREWPVTSARIEVVSVVEEIREGQYGSADVTGYAASLTYFYRNPDLQMGEYKRKFPLENAARRWAEGFKDKNVAVHVNPKDPTDSVLLKADLEAVSASSSPSMADAIEMENLPRLNRGYVALSGIAELASLAGLGAVVVAFLSRLTHGVFAWPVWLMVTVGALLAFCFISAWVVSYRADDSNRLQAMLFSSSLFCPAWMRWSVRLTGGLVFAFWLLGNIADILPPVARHSLAAFAPFWAYVFLCWGFLSTAATHTAILRSQENVRRPDPNDLPEAPGTA